MTAARQQTRSSSPAPVQLTPLEVALGIPYDLDDAVAPLPAAKVCRPGRASSFARAALEGVVLAALHRPPCLVSFSGGRDSSAVLAVAASVARREGLPAPVPVSLRFPGAADSYESEWQEQVVRHVGIRDWHRVELGNELDLLGDMAKRVMAAHGPLWPFNAHLLVPTATLAAGGT